MRHSVASSSMGACCEPCKDILLGRAGLTGGELSASGCAPEPASAREGPWQRSGIHSAAC